MDLGMHVPCTNCSARLDVPDQLLGRAIRCSACQSVFTPQAPPPPDTIPVLGFAVRTQPVPVREDHASPLDFEPPPTHDYPDIAHAVSGETISRIRQCATQFTVTGYVFAGIGFVALAVGLGLIAREESLALLVTLIPMSLASLGVGIFMIVVGSSFGRRERFGLVLTGAILSFVPALLVAVVAVLLVIRTRGVGRAAGIFIVMLFYAGVRTLVLLADSRVKEAFALEEARRLHGE